MKPLTADDLVEQWKDIQGYEGIYKISDFGNIKSFKFNKELNIIGSNCNGYRKVCLSKDGVINKFLIHRLVGFAFIPNPENKPNINHKNGIRNDNRVGNLEWCTQKENALHAFEIGLSKKGIHHYRYGKKNPNFSKKGKDHWKAKTILDLSTGVFYESLEDAAKFNSVKHDTLRKYLTKQRTNKTSLTYV
jgi:hypothetical protein